jgi:hypothetical protein
MAISEIGFVPWSLFQANANPPQKKLPPHLSYQFSEDSLVKPLNEFARTDQKN